MFVDTIGLTHNNLVGVEPMLFVMINSPPSFINTVFVKHLIHVSQSPLTVKAIKILTKSSLTHCKFSVTAFFKKIIARERM